MGEGKYSTLERSERATKEGYFSKSYEDIFHGSFSPEMNPNGVKIRESRDSEEHQNSLAIILALDMTGSMGNVPHHLIKEGLPNIMGNIIQRGEKDPQILFLGIGDHTCDKAPLQVGQFESSDELLDKWLTLVWPEEGGGGNAGESYLLAWYFAGYHTSIDCFEKRKRKGFLFTIGDEPTLKGIDSFSLKKIMGNGQYQDLSSAELLAKAREMYDVYHLHICETYTGSNKETINGWKQLMGDHLIEVEKHEDVSRHISEIILKSKGAINSEIPISTETEEKPGTMML